MIKNFSKLNCIKFNHLFLIILFLLVSSPTLFAEDEEDGNKRSDIHLEVSAARIAITSSFTGQDLVLFGQLPYHADIPLDQESEYDVIIKIKGSREKLTIRKKDRVMGMWLNLTEQEIEVPSFMTILSNIHLDEITNSVTLARYGIGLKAIIDDNLTERGEYSFLATGKESLEFLQALLELKKEEGLYSEEAYGVKFTSPSFFRAQLRLPANVDVGPYNAELFVFKDGNFIGSDTQTFLVVKEGFERDVTVLANENPLIYGVLAVIIAAMAGWIANSLMRN